MMPSIKRALVNAGALLGIGLLAGLGLLAVLWGCDFKCENDVKLDLLSPDGRHRLMVFSRECGATVASNRQVSVIGAGDRLADDGGNAFIADDGDVRVSWKADGGILIDHPGSLRIFKQEAAVDGVAVEYRKRP